MARVSDSRVSALHQRSVRNAVSFGRLLSNPSDIKTCYMLEIQNPYAYSLQLSKDMLSFVAEV